MIGEYIRSLRAAAGLKQKELAKRVGISASMLSLIEAGRREPTIKLLKQMSHALGIPTAAMFAVALADDDRSEANTPHAEKLRASAENLLSAVQRSLTLERLRRVREHS